MGSQSFLQNETLINLTSDNGLDDVSGGMTVMEWVMIVLKASLGSVAAFQNAVIFILLCMKKKRVVSELLVISNALLDTIMALIFLIKSTLFILLEKLPLFGRCIFQYFLYTFLTTASFLLIISISINRYVAVRHCHDYNTIFSAFRVRFLLAAIIFCSLLHSVPEIVVCKGYWAWYEDYWLFSRVFLVVSCCVVLLVVYSSISNRFSQPFWDPLFRPWRFYRQRKEAMEAARLATSKMTTTTCGLPNHNELLPSKSFCQFSSSGEQPSGQEHEEEAASSVSMSNEEPIISNQRRANAEIQLHDEFNNQNGISIQLLSPHQPQTSTIGTVNQIGAPVEPNQIKFRRPSRLNAELRRQNRRKTFQNQKHRITVSLFLVCLCFIIIIIPQTAIQLINYFTKNLSMSLVLNIYSITELIYLLNFVINPIIFAYNNSYLTEQIKKRIPKRFKKTSKKQKNEKAPNGVAATPLDSLTLKKSNIQSMPTAAAPIATDI